MRSPGAKSSTDLWTLHKHDARELNALLRRHASRTEFVTATITSPPYGGLKDYGAAGQIGFGQSYEDYLRDMETVFRQVHEHTTADGSLWLIADTYVADGGTAPRPLMPVPFDLAKAAEAAGFTLRDVIIWQKDRTLPWSNGTRLRNAFEYVLLLTKGPEPKYRLDRLREHSSLKEWWVRFPERYSPKGKAPSNVWSIPIPLQGSWGNGELDHSCPLPAELVRRLVLLSSDPGDVVLDPFAGSGVVLAVAEHLERQALGCEIVERHVEEFERMIRPEILARDNGSEENGNGSGNGASAELLIKLRMLKLPVVLLRAAAKLPRPISWPLAVVVLPKPSAGGESYGAARLCFCLTTKSAAEQRRARRALQELAARSPASKFGIEAEIEVIGEAELPRVMSGRRIYAYRNGATSRAQGPFPHRELADELAAAGEKAIPPVLSPLFVDVTPRPEEAIAKRR
jgi:DNA modification methylase